MEHCTWTIDLQLPPAFTMLHHVYGTPWVAILATSFCTLVFSFFDFSNLMEVQIKMYHLFPYLRIRMTWQMQTRDHWCRISHLIWFDVMWFIYKSTLWTFLILKTHEVFLTWPLPACQVVKYDVLRSFNNFEIWSTRATSLHGAGRISADHNSLRERITCM